MEFSLGFSKFLVLPCVFLVFQLTLCSTAENGNNNTCTPKSHTEQHGCQGYYGNVGMPGNPGIPGSAGIPGMPGPRGDPGQNGAHGDRGEKGENGTPGSPGQPGQVGVKGDKGQPGMNGEPGPKGYPGKRGPKGVEGPQGPAGKPGPQGDVGLPGLPGSEGIQGERGLNGSKGERGVKGEPGAGAGEVSRATELPRAKVAFSVAKTTTQGPASGSQAITFNKIHSNFGDGYEKSTGKFTCKVNGVYFFMISATRTTTHDMYACLIKNTARVMCVYARHSNARAHGSASNSVVVVLEEGDEVWVRLSSGKVVYGDNDGFTTFTGYLLFQDPE